jgi:hypothetical protein
MKIKKEAAVSFSSRIDKRSLNLMPAATLTMSSLGLKFNVVLPMIALQHRTGPFCPMRVLL